MGGIVRTRQHRGAYGTAFRQALARGAASVRHRWGKDSDHEEIAASARARLALVCVLAAPALAGPRTFVVTPSGMDDTAALQQAFDAAVAAGPGSVVKLTAGKFYTNEILVDGFDGCFKGAGMHRTVVDTLRGLDPALPGVKLVMDPDDETVPLFGWTSLIAFLQSDVRVADMSFDITAKQPCEAMGGRGPELDHLSDVFIVTRDSRSSFDRVGFTSHDGELNGFNLDGAAAIYDTSGTHRVTRCSFQGGNDGLETAGITGGGLSSEGVPAWAIPSTWPARPAP